MNAHDAPITASFTAFDWFLAGVVVISGVMALRKGFIRVVFSLAGLGAGLILASWYYLRVALALREWVANPLVAQVIGFLAILMATLFLFSIAAMFLRRAATAVGLGLTDRVLGGALGVARGFLVCITIIIGVAAFGPHSGLGKDSVLTPYFLDAAHAVSFVVPAGFEQRFSLGEQAMTKNSSKDLKPSALPQ